MYVFKEVVHTLKDPPRPWLIDDTKDVKIAKDVQQRLKSHVLSIMKMGATMNAVCRTMYLSEDQLRRWLTDAHACPKVTNNMDNMVARWLLFQRMKRDEACRFRQASA